jgi:aminocarboxymuconate-semialdehyde decarboxylase
MNGQSDEPFLVRCHDHVRAGMRPGVRLPFRTIDLHCHMLVPEVESLVTGSAGKERDADASVRTFGAESIAVNVEQVKTVTPKLTRLEERLADMDMMGVDVQAISITPNQYYYWAEEELARPIVSAVNTHIAEACAKHPDRLIGLGTVSLQFPELAATQLEYGMRTLGFRGVEISTQVEGKDIADRFFDPFWAKADELGAVVFIHPWGTTIGDRLSRHYLGNTVGQPMETAIALSNIIFNGTLDRYPGVKIVAAHGGGYLPLYISRSDHAYAARPDAQGCSCRPSDYLKRIWFDSLVYTPDHLARLIEVVGVSQIVLGTDYPFDMGHYDPAGVLGGFPAAVQKAIAGGNAAMLLGLAPQEVTEK